MAPKKKVDDYKPNLPRLDLPRTFEELELHIEWLELWLQLLRDAHRVQSKFRPAKPSIPLVELIRTAGPDLVE